MDKVISANVNISTRDFAIPDDRTHSLVRNYKKCICDVLFCIGIYFFTEHNVSVDSIKNRRGMNGRNDKHR